MSITVHEFDGITRQFCIKPDQIPTMSTPTLTSNYTIIKEFEVVLRENTLAITSYHTHLGHLALVITTEEFALVNSNHPFIKLLKEGFDGCWWIPKCLHPLLVESMVCIIDVAVVAQM